MMFFHIFVPHHEFGNYIYVAISDPFVPTKVEIALPKGFHNVGDLHRTSGMFYSQSGTTVYRDTIIFSQEFTGEGGGSLTCKVSYQCCDQHICFPPGDKECTIKWQAKYY